MRLPILQLSCRPFWKSITSPRSVSTPTAQIWLPATSGVSQSSNHCWKEDCDGRVVHKLSQRRLTADCLAPRESDCSRMHSKVSSDWLPSYIKATRPVLEIFKMVGYFTDSPSRLVQMPQSGSRVLCNIAKLLPHYTASCSRRQSPPDRQVQVSLKPKYSVSTKERWRLIQSRLKTDERLTMKSPILLRTRSYKA